MSSSKATPRRVRVEGEDNRSIYRRPDGKLEIGFRDSAGRQRWRGPFDTVSAARRERDRLRGAKLGGERIEPNPRLRFGQAAERWLREEVEPDLRPATRAAYETAVRCHLEPRWGRRRMDGITVTNAARLVRELRDEGKAEATIHGVIVAASRVFKHAQRHQRWSGEDPIARLSKRERPRVSQASRRRIFTADELAQTLRAAREPWRTFLSLAAVTGARVSELVGLTWADLDLSDPSAATATIAYQCDRRGRRVELKTEESRRTIELPRQLAAMLLEHRARSAHCYGDDFVFCTRTGRALSQRNVSRALRAAQRRATDDRGRPTFPILHEDGPPPRGSVPSMHSFRHTAASEAIAAGESAEEVSWMLGHRNSIVTRAVYVQEVRNAERQARRRAKLEARYGAMLDGVGERAAPTEAPPGGQVVSLDDAREAAA